MGGLCGKKEIEMDHVDDPAPSSNKPTATTTPPEAAETDSDQPVSDEVVTEGGAAPPSPEPVVRIKKKSSKPIKTPIKDDFKLGKELGRGAFAVVHQCTEIETGDLYAVKVIQKKNLSDDAKRSLATEISILQKVEHPNCINLYALYENEGDVFLVMELVTGGELFDKIVDKGCYTESDAAVLVKQILSAVQYLHSLGIVHRDLKPENLLVKSPKEDTNVKIADFGLSKIIDDKKLMSTACGTPGYVAPEVLQALDSGYTPKVDMWSIGIISYILLCGFPPFYAEAVPELFELIIAAEFEYPEEYWRHVSDEAKDFIDKLLVVDPEARMTAEEALKHPWMSAAGKKGKKDLLTTAGMSKRLKSTVEQRREVSRLNMTDRDGI